MVKRRRHLDSAVVLTGRWRLKPWEAKPGNALFLRRPRLCLPGVAVRRGPVASNRCEKLRTRDLANRHPPANIPYRSLNGPQGPSSSFTVDRRSLPRGSRRCSIPGADPRRRNAAHYETYASCFCTGHFCFYTSASREADVAKQDAPGGLKDMKLSEGGMCHGKPKEHCGTCSSEGEVR